MFTKLSQQPNKQRRVKEREASLQRGVERIGRQRKRKARPAPPRSGASRLAEEAGDFPEKIRGIDRREQAADSVREVVGVERD